MGLNLSESTHESYADHGPSIVDLGPIRPHGRGAYKLGGAAKVQSADEAGIASPTLSLSTILKSFLVTVVVVCLFGAQGLTEQARTMPNGPAADATMAVGDTSLAVQQFLHLSGPWENFSAWIGHPVQTKPSQLDKTFPVPTPTPTTKHTVGGGKKPGGHKKPKPKPKPWPKIPPVTKSHPLNLLVMGDSLPGYMGPQVLTLAHSEGPVTGTTESIDGTGLCRPDAYDWLYWGPKFVRENHAQAVVVFMGGNDSQNIVTSNGNFYQAGTKAWGIQYQGRAQLVMHALLKAGAKRVYWLSMPPVDSSLFLPHTTWEMDQALRRAAKNEPGVHYVNINPWVTVHGKYSAYINVDGVPTLIREPDGIHLDADGSQVVTDKLVPILKQEWKFGWRQVYNRTHPHHGHHHKSKPAHHKHSVNA